MTSLKKSGAITFATQGAIFAIGFATSIILARVLGPANRGIYALLMLIPSVMVLTGGMGLEVANVYYSANRKYKLDDIISNSLFATVAISSIIIILWWAISDTRIVKGFIEKNNIAASHLWALILFAIPLMFFYGFYNKILLGREQIIKFNLTNAFQSILQLASIIILLVVLGQGIYGAVLSFIIAVAGSSLLVGFFIFRLGKIKFSINPGLVKDSIRYGGKAYLGNMLQFLNYRLDMFLVAYFMDVRAVGYYVISVVIVEKLWMIPNSLATVLFPRISAIDSKEANHVTCKTSRHTLIVVFALSLLLLVLARPLIRLLFGHAFLPSVEPLIFLLPGVVALSYAKILTSDLAGRGRPEFGTLAAFVSLTINIPLNLFLIPIWGIAGAAFASSVAYALASLIVTIAFIKITGVSWRNTLFMTSDDFKGALKQVCHLWPRTWKHSAD